MMGCWDAKHSKQGRVSRWIRAWADARGGIRARFFRLRKAFHPRWYQERTCFRRSRSDLRSTFSA